LHTELGLQLVYEEKRRQGLWTLPDTSRSDLISHYGVSLGNVATYANAGFELRVGTGLPDDFGTSPIRPGGDNQAPMPAGASRRSASPGVHFFASLDARLVARNIFLDGNTLASSHHVNKRYGVADLSLGIAWRGRFGKIAYAYYLRSKEFNEQLSAQRFGSLTLSAEF
jgi:lipid A 3-O-deacylase